MRKRSLRQAATRQQTVGTRTLSLVLSLLPHKPHSIYEVHTSVLQRQKKARYAVSKRATLTIPAMQVAAHKGCVNRRSASCRYFVAVWTSSKPRELAAYLANFWASVTAFSDGLKPGAGSKDEPAQECRLTSGGWPAKSTRIHTSASLKTSASCSRRGAHLPAHSHAKHVRAAHLAEAAALGAAARAAVRAHSGSCAGPAPAWMAAAGSRAGRTVAALQSATATRSCLRRIKVMISFIVQE